ncbi:MAG: hypothetical protein K6C36_00885, partial [Clostridia bacterium]|nr:hypothetical protein [Clostridia bacterium]
MIKIVDKIISDIIRHPAGAVFAIAGVSGTASNELSFFSFDVRTRAIDRIAYEKYLEYKFGSFYEDIASVLTDTVSCSCAQLADGSTFVIYTNGDTGIFDAEHDLVRTGRLYYRNQPAMGAAAQDGDVWCCVPRENLIIRYSPERDLITMRIGGTS